VFQTTMVTPSRATLCLSQPSPHKGNSLYGSTLIHLICLGWGFLFPAKFVSSCVTRSFAGLWQALYNVSNITTRTSAVYHQQVTCQLQRTIHTHIFGFRPMIGIRLNHDYWKRFSSNS